MRSFNRANRSGRQFGGPVFRGRRCVLDLRFREQVREPGVVDIRFEFTGVRGIHEEVLQVAADELLVGDGRAGAGNRRQAG